MQRGHTFYDMICHKDLCALCWPKTICVKKGILKWTYGCTQTCMCAHVLSLVHLNKLSIRIYYMELHLSGVFCVWELVLVLLNPGRSVDPACLWGEENRAVIAPDLCCSIRILKLWAKLSQYIIKTSLWNLSDVEAGAVRRSVRRSRAHIVCHTHFRGRER